MYIVVSVALALLETPANHRKRARSCESSYVEIVVREKKLYPNSYPRHDNAPIREINFLLSIFNFNHFLRFDESIAIHIIARDICNI